VQFIGQQPSNYKQENDNAERHQRTALAAVLTVMVRHIVCFQCSNGSAANL